MAVRRQTLPSQACKQLIFFWGVIVRVDFRCPPELFEFLPRPVPARDGLPEWLRSMPGEAPVAALGGAIRTLKHCPPLIDAMRAGFLMPLAADVRVEDGVFSWDWPLPPTALGRITRSPLSFHHAEQASGSPLHDPGRVFVKFNTFWTIALEPGWSLLAMHPANRADLPFETLTGLVDADLYGDGLIHFPARWLDAGFAGVLPRGTPVAQCIPVRREALELAFAPLAGDAALRFADLKDALAAEPGVYRKRYRAAKP
jgi:hypothetical protein